ncbi:hypothetical protein BKD09_13300 [Bradyrhizobium japonicum]|uniref:Uncharacterized protein n=1 Tax=Bradyrhizobium japonicum TaxID=375 RepID=A0A1L3F7R2_BRAJP|nr:hypothetical protein BKD09_13300 [Bradyrhizobium japonicum]
MRKQWTACARQARRAPYKAVEKLGMSGGIKPWTTLGKRVEGLWAFRCPQNDLARQGQFP